MSQHYVDDERDEFTRIGDDSVRIESQSPWIKQLDANILLVFTHIPKAGGTSFNALIASIYGDRMLKYHPAFNHDILERLTSDKARRIMCISAHKPYPLHKEFGGEAALRTHPDGLFAGRDIRYVTIVRHPLDRMISYFNFVTSFQLHHHYEKMRDMDVGAFFDFLVERNDPELSNLQCMLIGGGARSFAAAQANLRNNYYKVAPLERIAQMIDGLRRELNWPVLQPERPRNVSLPKVKRETLAPKIRDLILSHNLEDLALYEFVMDQYAHIPA